MIRLISGFRSSEIGRLVARAALVAALGLVAPGCFVWGHSGPTPVSMGQRYTSGVTEYDEFFDNLHKLQLEMAAAPRDEKALRSKLATDIGLDDDSSVRLITTRIKKLSEELAAHGTELRVEFIGLDDDSHEADAIVSVVKSSGNSDDAALVKAFERGAKGAVKLVAKMRDSKRGARRLNAGLAPLETEVDVRFKLLGPARTNDVRRNLYDAKVMLPLIVERSDSVERDARDLIVALQDATVRPKDDQYQAPEDVQEKAPAKADAKPDPKASVKSAPATPATGAKPGAPSGKAATPNEAATNRVKPTGASAKPKSSSTQLADFSP